MKRNILPGIRCVVFTLLTFWLSGCVCFRRPPLDAEKAIQGTWKSEHSAAVYEIAMIDGKMTVNGHSSISGKELMISDTSWDGKMLKFTSYLPSTNFKVVHKNRMTDRNTMESLTMGKADYTVIWNKEKYPAPNDSQ